ncbi:serine/threonine protein kinase [Polaromonas sp.]|uniref:serine/threonine protein kinase n=1 Tax=Polaromonas sp. TaxID=1869339 RepID=UPI003753C28B
MTALPSGTPVSLMTHADALAPGTRLAEFELLGVLGVGGFGMVYQAFDHSLQRPVAIKEYLPVALAGRGQEGAVIVRDPADQPAFATGLQSFVAEARLLAQFDHPSLVKVFRYWEGNQTAYMVMPLYRGMTLQAARTQMRCPPPEAWLRKVLWAVLGALKTLHHGSAVHRDVSPDNIFLQDSGPPVLLDLGAARHAIGGKTQDLTDALKLSYAPLEQHSKDPGMRQGPWTDLYALAAVVHGLLCNKPPLPATFRAVRDRLPPFARVARTVQEQFGQAYSPAFVRAMGQALAITPKDRPQTVVAMVQAMGLETPNGMSRFDWRAELGAIWVQPGLPWPHQAVSRVADPVQAPVPSEALTQPLPASTRQRQAPSSIARARSLPVRRAMPWRIGAGVAVVLLVAASAAVFTGRSGVAPVQGMASVAPPSEPPVLMATALPVPVAAANPQPATTQTASAAVAVASPVPPKRAVRRKEAQAEPTPLAPPAPVAVLEQPAAPQRPESAVVAPVLADPRLSCADRNFLGRSLCIYRECQKPGMAALPLCVENNEQMQNSRKFEGF